MSGTDHAVILNSAWPLSERIHNDQDWMRRADPGRCRLAQG